MTDAKINTDRFFNSLSQDQKVNYARLFRQVMTYGKAICGIRERKWYNPLRYIQGRYYQGVIPINHLYKRRK
jgi:hypothetical protein